MASTSVHTFHEHLQQSRRIMAIVGSGLAAPPDPPTYEDIDMEGTWHGHDIEALSTVHTFLEAPELMWRYHEDLRRQAQEARPNAAHDALATLASVKGPEDFICVTTNIDGLCARAGHPKGQLFEIKGSLFNAECFDPACDYYQENFESNVTEQGVPRCPKCDCDLRPAVVWHGEILRQDTVNAAESFLTEDEPVDLILVIGTTAGPWPDVGLMEAAIAKGARVAMINADRGHDHTDDNALGLTERDWSFVGDLEELVHQLLEPVIRERIFLALSNQSTTLFAQ